MTRSIFLKLMRAMTGVAPVLALAACAPPDRWGPFVDDQPSRTPPPLAVTAHLASEDATAFLPDDAIPDDGPLALSVEDATLLVLDRNRDLRVQRFDPLIAATFETIERGVFDPEVFARLEYFEDEGTEISRATGENFPTIRRDTAAEAGIRQTLPTGTDIEATISTDRSTSNRAPEQQSGRVGLSVTQALLRGFGPAVNLARVRQAELETTASLYELQGFTEALLADAESVYWQYKLAARRIEIFEESLALAQRQRQEVHDRIEIGVLAETERASADAEVAQREQELIDARASLSALRIRLLRLINPNGRNTLERELIATSDPTVDAAPLDDLDERIELATQARPDLNEARLRLDQRRLETIVTRNGLLPRLDFFIALGKTGFATELLESFEQLDGPTYDLTAGLEFSYPIGNRIAEGLHRNAVLSRQQAFAAILNLEQLVRHDVRLAAVEVERSRQQISASAATRALREEALRAEEERFRVGESTSLLVAQAQRDLLESQIAEVDAVVAYRLALIDLYLAEGSLLARRGVLVE